MLDYITFSFISSSEETTDDAMRDVGPELA